MATDVVMPRLSDSMEEGTILQWMKQVGEQVAVGEELVEIETDKANMAYEADTAGTLIEILAQEGATLPIGEVIARIGDSSEGSGASAAGPVGAGDPPHPPVAKASSGEGPPTPPPAEDASETAAEAPSAEVSSAAEPPPQATTAASGSERPKASPLARRIAKESGVDLTQLSGSGPGGRILKTDVEHAASESAVAAAGGVGGGGSRTDRGSTAGPPSPTTGPAAPAAGTETAKGEVRVEELSKLQSTVARRMAESKATAPHFYLEAEVDMTAAVAARGQLKAAAAARAGDDAAPVPSYNDMVVKACALALREFPRANGAYRDGRFELYSRVNVGIAVAAADALLVPTIFDADGKGLTEIAADARRLSQRGRDGEITPPELSGATFTVSNLGMFGVDSFSAVINPPQAAILAVGAIVERPLVHDGGIVAASVMRLTLSCDHRILYGADGARFLARIRELLETPLLLAG